MSENTKKAQHLKAAAIQELVDINWKWGACSPYTLASQVPEGCGGQPGFGGYEKDIGGVLSHVYRDSYNIRSSNSWPEEHNYAIVWVGGPEPKRLGLHQIIPQKEWQMLLRRYNDEMTRRFGPVGATILTGVGIVLGAVLLVIAPGLALKIAGLLLGIYEMNIEEEMKMMGEDIRVVRTKILTVKAELNEKIREEAQEEQMKGIGKALIPLVLLAGVVGLGS